MDNLQQQNHFSLSQPQHLRRHTGNHSSNNNIIQNKLRRNDRQAVDFSELDITSLKRYKRLYKLRTRNSSSKPELVSAVSKHFATISVNELEIIEQFLEIINSQGKSSPRSDTDIH